MRSTKNSDALHSFSMIFCMREYESRSRLGITEFQKSDPKVHISSGEISSRELREIWEFTFSSWLFTKSAMHFRFSFTRRNATPQSTRARPLVPCVEEKLRMQRMPDLRSLS